MYLNHHQIVYLGCCLHSMFTAYILSHLHTVILCKHFRFSGGLFAFSNFYLSIAKPWLFCYSFALQNLDCAISENLQKKCVSLHAEWVCVPVWVFFILCSSCVDGVVWWNFRVIQNDINPFSLRKAKIVYNFGFSECNRVNTCSIAAVHSNFLYT